MRTFLRPLCVLIAAVVCMYTANAQAKVVMVGGAAMYPNKNIVENALNSNEHTTLMAAIKAAGLIETLGGKGPFTVFAPTNAAFNKLPAGTVETLLKPENKAVLTMVLTYHVVPGTINSVSLKELIKKNGGKLTVNTVQGGGLTFTMNGDNIMLQDEKGGISKVTIADVYQSNGVMHVIDTVVMPNS